MQGKCTSLFLNNRKTKIHFFLSVPDYEEEESEIIVHVPDVDQSKPEMDQSCPEGQTYCLGTRVCSKDCNQTPINEDQTSCRQGETYCLSTKSCSKAKDCATQDNEVGKSRREADRSCLNGEHFCLETGKCSLDCNDNASGRDDTRCPLGQIYCLGTESCAEKCDKVQTEKRNSEKTCPDGQTLCLVTGLCDSNCDVATGEAGTDAKCPQGQIFCLKSQTCANTCDGGNDKGLGRITKRGAFDCPGLNSTNDFEGNCTKKQIRFTNKILLKKKHLAF